MEITSHHDFGTTPLFACVLKNSMSTKLEKIVRDFSCTNFHEIKGKITWKDGANGLHHFDAYPKWTEWPLYYGS
jgi:hypothetical protein